MRVLRLTEHARAQGKHGAFHDRVMDADWADAQDIGDPEVLSTDAYVDDVRRSTENAHAIGINGIPAFLLDRRRLVLGAHPTETFERAFAQLGSD